MTIGKNGEMILEVGDRVRIKDKPVYDTDLHWAGEMTQCCGQEVTISRAFRLSNGKAHYHIKENGWTYSNAFFQIDGTFMLSKDTGGALALEGFSDYLESFHVVR